MAFAGNDSASVWVRWKRYPDAVRPKLLVIERLSQVLAIDSALPRLIGHEFADDRTRKPITMPLFWVYCAAGEHSTAVNETVYHRSRMLATTGESSHVISMQILIADLDVPRAVEIPAGRTGRYATLTLRPGPPRNGPERY